MGIVARFIVLLSFILLLPVSLYAANSELTVAGGATLTLGNNVSLHTGGNLNIGSATSVATVVCKPAGATTNTRILIDVGGNMTIVTGSLIRGNGFGYAAQYGPLSPADYTSTLNILTNYAGKDFTRENSSGGGVSHHGAGGAGVLVHIVRIYGMSDFRTPDTPELFLTTTGNGGRSHRYPLAISLDLFSCEMHPKSFDTTG